MKTPAARTHWATMGESTFVAGIWLLFWIHRLSGRWLFRACLAPVVLAHWLCRPALRTASLQYLRRLQASQRVFDHEPGWRESLKHVALFAETMLDKLLAMAGRYPRERVSFQGREMMLRAIAAKQGGLLVTAHVGCLELCRAMSERTPGFRLNVLVHTRHAEAFNAMLRRLHPNDAVTLIEVSEVGVPTALLLGEKIAAGEFVAIAGDRVPVHQSKTARVDFLGHEAPFPVGAYVLASLLKCPLYMLGCVHEARGYAVQFQLLADRVVLPRADRAAALRSHAQAFADALTAQLRRSPYDWFNFFPFWDQVPTDEVHHP